jgi:hypothetical protein
MYDVFLSHNRQQKYWVREFCQILRQGGLTVFFDEDSIEPGDSVVRAIEEALVNSRHVVLVISPSSMSSKWVAMETAITVYSDPDVSRKVLIPIILESVEPTLIRPSVRSLNSIDLTDPQTRDKRFQQLLGYLGFSASVIPTVPAWPQIAIETKTIQISALSVADIDDVISWGWDGLRLLDELIQLDYQTMEGLTPDHEGQTRQWAPVFMDHPDTWRLIVNSSGKIVGYWHFVPLFEPEYNLARQGQLIDGHITTDKLKLFELPGQYDVYFVTMCIQSQFRRTPAVRLLFNSLLQVIAYLAQEGVFIREVCANAYTPSGVSLCRSLGLMHVGNHISHGQIFLAKFSSLLCHELSRPYPELRRAYADLFG